MQKSQEDAQKYIHELYNILQKREKLTPELLDISDVLLQVYQKLDHVKNPEALVNRLVNYIRATALAGRIHFPANEEQLIMELALIGQRAGLNGNNGRYIGKSEFYSYSDGKIFHDD